MSRESATRQWKARQNAGQVRAYRDASLDSTGPGVIGNEGTALFRTLWFADNEEGSRNIPANEAREDVARFMKGKLP